MIQVRNYYSWQQPRQGVEDGGGRFFSLLWKTELIDYFILHLFHFNFPSDILFNILIQDLNMAISRLIYGAPKSHGVGIRHKCLTYSKRDKSPRTKVAGVSITYNCFLVFTSYIFIFKII